MKIFLLVAENPKGCELVVPERQKSAKNWTCEWYNCAERLRHYSTLTNILEALVSLHTCLTHNPRHLFGWYILAKLYETKFENYAFALKAFQLSKRLTYNTKFGMYDKLRVKLENHLTRCTAKSTEVAPSPSDKDLSAFERAWFERDTNDVLAELDEPDNDVNPQNM